MVNTLIWKIATIIILVYVFTVGFITPLKPGVFKASPFKAICGQELELDLEGYNSLYKTNESSLEAWLKLDSVSAIKAHSFDVKSENQLIAKFSIPSSLPGNSKSISTTLLLHNEEDGASIMPDAVILKDEDLSDNGLVFFESIPYDKIHTKDAFAFPFRSIIYETVRNTFFHVALWMSMMLLLMAGLWHSIKVLRQDDFVLSDIRSANYTKVAILFGLLGIATGSIWAKYTWGTFWTTDIKLNMSAIAMLMYTAYIVLRNSIDDLDKRARVSAVYSIFAFVALFPLIFVLPRMMDSLHPGNGGNPALGGEDMDNTLRMVFYPAIIGMAMLGAWIADLKIRIEKLELQD